MMENKKIACGESILKKAHNQIMVVSLIFLEKRNLLSKYLIQQFVDSRNPLTTTYTSGNHSVFLISSSHFIK